jgi:hypothetical protein
MGILGKTVFGLMLVALVASAALFGVAFAGTGTREVLVLINDGGTKMTTTYAKKGTILVNQGPNNIWCAVGPPAEPGRSLRVHPGGSFSVGTVVDIYCRAETANQIGDAGTVVIEVP